MTKALDASRKREKIKASVIAYRLQGMPLREIARLVGASFGLVKRICIKEGIDCADKGSWKEDESTAVWTSITKTPIRTLEDALKSAKVDETVWYVDRWECNAWNVVAKDAAKVAHQHQNYQVKVFLKRIANRSIQKAQEAIFERMKKYAPKFPKAFFAKKQKGEEYLVIAGLFDAHFGKYAWAAETGNDYDVEIASRIYLNAIDDLVEESRGKKVGRWVLPIGNDFFHMDNSRNTTFAGTPQDVDGRYAKVIEAGEMSVIKAIERMMRSAPVDVVWIPGNHDPTTSYHLARTIAAWYRNADNVAVDHGPATRKYYRWGTNLIGMTHGNEEKIHELPNLMASQMPDDWAECKNGSREWLIGHWHSSRRWVTKATETSKETIIRGLMSLSGTDAWHARNGYIGTHQAAEAYYYKKTGGYAGHIVAYAR